MNSYFEIGGRILECANDVNYETTSMSRTQKNKNQRAIKEAVSTAKKTGEIMSSSLEAAGEDRFGFEEAGQLVGLWVGLGFGLATMPVVAVDGPLPFADAAWVISTARMTKTAIDVGGEVGAIIDSMIE